MRTQGCFIVVLLLVSLLTGCFSNLWTGAVLIYDRHNVYKKVNDYQLAANAQQKLYQDKVFKQEGCAIDLAVFNGDILLAGHVSTSVLRETAVARVLSLSGYRRVFNQIEVGKKSANTLQDSWITTKIRSRIFADATIDPGSFKIVTSDRIVYLMGDVKPDQAARVIDIARNVSGVIRVVKLLKYYHLSEQAALNQG
ncbi:MULTISPECIES: BON domain-containing protein [unclassified Legionella]|uniref:BON domain-containing protein n=1 Tax=unclassified Legionella TaxID=2622702 RepID=UPI0010562944|nr:MULTISPECIES: BON domain-containing protein [unclassified Legionella]MDI9818005.1 BON domain-containing protein [Legionella sp. PL877]